jgi:hypothetical protein
MAAWDDRDELAIADLPPEEEVTVEGSDDGKTWQEIGLYQKGSLKSLLGVPEFTQYRVVPTPRQPSRRPPDASEGLFALDRAMKSNNVPGDLPEYPTDLSEGEGRKGFELKTIPNPNGHYAFAPRTILAAVLDPKNGTIVVKARDPFGRVGYATLDAKTHRPSAPMVFDLSALPDVPSGKRH